jgi:hypothetical protein
MAPTPRRGTALVQMVAVAAVIATMVYFPLGIALASGLALWGISPDELVTFGGAFNRIAGLLAWWLIVFAPTLVYAGLAFPWAETRGSATRAS